ncbi:acyltransferase [Leptospira kobayashii]|uniref:Acyltransferase n=1 Tax=Leptospira kobayashii TaxID=1917830 RepID=A0ABM7UT57_9LEPT|nr:MBOAT family O-acyltransferase [Leptospira kobayashii]BDA79814.1 acyltransferase [Leptospira kobayashii]
MLFNSIPFLVSFIVFFIIYSFLDRKKQNILLLLYGIYFYSYWNWKMTILLLFSISVNYLLGIYIEQQSDLKKKKKILYLGISLNLILLGWFKYALFLLGLIGDGIHLFNEGFSIWRPEILLPVGISFYTFHNISYLVEVESERIKASRSIVEFGVYDIFFPLLLAGPIERPNSLLPQLARDRRIEKNSMFHGISLVCWGIFQKAVIADPLAKFVDGSLANTGQLPDGLLWVVAPAFAFQVYADFSGYSNCARGLAYMMGFQLMNNFHRPFFATNPSEFWQRWHISLSSWLRDYVYIPLGGNRFGFVRQNINILIVWILGGLWHGATYGYLIWGIYLGLCIVVYNVFKRSVPKNSSEFQDSIFKYIGRTLTFFSFAFGLLLFRVNDFQDLLVCIKNILSFSKEVFSWAYVFIFILPILLFDSWQEKEKTKETDWKLTEKPYLFPVLFVFGFVVFSLISPFAKQEFFYFQF